MGKPPRKSEAEGRPRPASPKFCSSYNAMLPQHCGGKGRQSGIKTPPLSKLFQEPSPLCSFRIKLSPCLQTLPASFVTGRRHRDGDPGNRVTLPQEPPRISDTFPLAMPRALPATPSQLGFPDKIQDAQLDLSFR